MYHNLPLGANAPKEVNAIVEIPRGSHNKYEFDEQYGVIRLDRVLHSPFFYPVDYGYIPETLALDGDHLDIMIYNDSNLFPGCLIAARPIGVLLMEDENGEDEKILAVAQKNPIHDTIFSLKDVSPHFLKEISHFFTEYKRLEKNKHAIVKGWKDVEVAHKIILKSHQAFLKQNSVHK